MLAMTCPQADGKPPITISDLEALNCCRPSGLEGDTKASMKFACHSTQASAYLSHVPTLMPANCFTP